ncbi:MAG: hypothetical protein PHP92_04865 [Candidatus Nanoarchaeia archaeon]|nr:hypothetical protein [Candidatus Nanoarchaeia archaeon]
MRYTNKSMSNEYNKIVEMTDETMMNFESIEKNNLEIKKINYEIPNLNNYDDISIQTYLLNEGYVYSSADYTYYFDLIKTKFQKRQRFDKTIEYLKTLNLIINEIIEYYKRNGELPTRSVLESLSGDIGILDDRTIALDYVEEKVWINL